QIFGGRLAGAAVCDDIETDSLPLIEGAHAGAFNRADMNEDIIAAIGGLNEAKTLLAVEPLHNSRIHRRDPFMTRYTLDLGAEDRRLLSVDRFWRRGLKRARLSVMRRSGPGRSAKCRLAPYGRELQRRQGLRVCALPNACFVPWLRKNAIDQKPTAFAGVAGLTISSICPPAL